MLFLLRWSTHTFLPISRFYYFQKVVLGLWFSPPVSMLIGKITKEGEWLLLAHCLMLLLLLLSRFSRVRLCDPIDGSPPGSVLGILQARTLEWIAISFPNACMHAKPLQSCPTLCDPMDSSPPGSPVHGLLENLSRQWIYQDTGGCCQFLLQLPSYSLSIFFQSRGQHNNGGATVQYCGSLKAFRTYWDMGAHFPLILYFTYEFSLIKD